MTSATVPPVVIIVDGEPTCPICGSPDSLTAWQACRRAHYVQPGKDGRIRLIDQNETDDWSDDYEVYCGACLSVLTFPPDVIFDFE